MSNVMTNEEILILEAPLFRGATRPTMLFGIPMDAFIKLMSPFFLLFLAFFETFGLLTFVYIVLPALIVLMFARQLTKRDNHYMNMFFMQINESVVFAKNKDRQNNLKIIPPRSIFVDTFQRDVKYNELLPAITIQEMEEEIEKLNYETLKQTAKKKQNQKITNNSNKNLKNRL